jgi:hypothetical protein
MAAPPGRPYPRWSEADHDESKIGDASHWTREEASDHLATLFDVVSERRVVTDVLNPPSITA